MAKYAAVTDTLDPELALAVPHIADRELACEEISIHASAAVAKGDILALTTVGSGSAAVTAYAPITSGYSSGALAVAMEKVTAGATVAPVGAVRRAAVIAIPASAAYFANAKTQFEAQGCKVIAR